MAHEAAIQQKKQDDCKARLNAVGSSSDRITEAFRRLANADRCLANPNITAEEATQLKPGEVLGNPVEPPSGYTLDRAPQTAPDTLPADFFRKSASSVSRSARQTTSIEGTVTKDAIVYDESLPGGPGGRVLGKVGTGTRVRVIRLDSIYGNVQVRTLNGITGWINAGDVSY